MRIVKKSLMVLLCLVLLCCAACQALANETSADAGGLVFNTTDGSEIRVSDVLKERRMILVQFFTTSGRAGRLSFPALKDSYENWKDLAEVIAVSVDEQDSREAVDQFARETGLSFPMVAGNEAPAMDGLGLTDSLTAAVIDRSGQIALYLSDVQTDVSAYDRIFEYFCSDDYTLGEAMYTLPPARVSLAGPADETLTGLLTKDPRIRVTSLAGNYVWPFQQQGNAGVISSNGGISNSVCGLSAFVDAPQDSVFSYRFRVSSERLYDALVVSVDGEEARVYSGDTAWQNDALPLSAGEHEISFLYQKNESADEGLDLVLLSGFSLKEGGDAQQALESLPHYPAGEQTEMTLINEDAQRVWVEDPSGILQTIFGPGPMHIYVLESPQADINLTLNERENPWTVCLTVGNAMEIQDILPFSTESGYRLTVPCFPDRYTQITALSKLPGDAQKRIIDTMLIFPDMDLLENWFSWLKSVRQSELLWNVGLEEKDETYLWQVKVQDIAGNPVPGCAVVFSTREASARVITDEKGLAVFESAPENYRVRLDTVPEGYVNPSSREVVMPNTGGTTGFILVKQH